MTINQLTIAAVAMTIGTSAQAQEYIETRDLVPLCDSIIEVTTDGYPGTKFVFTYDRFGGRTDSACYIWRGGKWQNHYHYTHERNEDGNITKSAYYKWDTKTEEWIPSGRMYEYYYDGKKKIGEASYYWSDNRGKYEPKDKMYNYTVNGINTVIYYIVSSDHFDLYAKTVTAKTQTGKDSYVEKYLWHDGKQIWQGQYKSYNSYDKVDNLVESISYGWDNKNDAWYSYPNGKIEYLYDQENYCTGALRYLWNAQAECWYQHGADNYGKPSYTYDELGRIIKRDFGSWLEQFAYDSHARETYHETGYYLANGDYHLEDRHEHNYDDHGNLTYEYRKKEQVNGEYSEFKTESNYDYSTGHCEAVTSYLEDGQWVESVKIERDFDGEERTLKYVEYHYDQYVQNWVGWAWEEYAYHINGYYSMNLSYHWDTYQNAWVGNEKYEYDFDDKGRQTLWAYYHGMSDDGKYWRPTSKYISHYDDDDRLIKREVYQSLSWGDDPYSWTHTWNYLYYYGGKTIDPDAVAPAPRTSVFAVYSLDGTKVYSGPAASWHQPRHGVYIVRDGDRTYKVGR